MNTKVPMQVPYGAVYFRKSNPPKKDWERDYRTASEDGVNIFRHWFMWGAIEVAPGVFDWEDFDRQLDLAEKHGIKTIIAEIIHSIPEWVYRRYPHLVYERADGSRARSLMGHSSATGGFGAGLCLDSEEARSLAGNFLSELARRYRSHPALLGYDVWNECNYPHDVCYCENTQKKFRRWLAEKYGNVAELNRAWQRYSYTEWDDVMAPAEMAIYPECIDWLDFRKDTFHEQMQWRIDTLREVDGKALMSAHGIAASISNMALGGSDDWLAASKVELYGFTWVASRKGAEPWKQWHAVDLVRSASRGKPFWHAEAQGGPLWLQPQVVGRPRNDGRVTEAEDLRIWNLTSFAGGARGILFPRWRSLLDGPLFGAFGPYGMDGSRTEQSAMAGRIAVWANEAGQRKLFEAHPIRGDIGILVVPESQTGSYLLAQNGAWDLYAPMMWGAYRAFFDRNIQADWVHINDMDGYRTLYFPYPIMLSEGHARRLMEWVEAGGALVCEGCPAYFGAGGHVGEVQPNFGLDALFGAVQSDVEFMPDILKELSFHFDGDRVQGGTYLQTYRPTTGTARGFLSDGSVVAVEHSYGTGKTLLVGTFPSEAYYRTQDGATGRFFAGVLAWAGIEQAVVSSLPDVTARLSEGDDGLYLWALNSSRGETEVELAFASRFSFKPGALLWEGGTAAEAGARRLTLKIRGRDAVIMALSPGS
ncbi:MAG TPA: beta-galactosidase [Spirochaetia bacterium]|nr:beta-galactosidase [Spirochaetia bacterium]